MKTIYLDDEYRCHVNNGGSMVAVETGLFDGKCAAYIEGFRLIPEGHVWTRSDGQSFAGLMVTPWKPYEELDYLQREYERQQLASMQEVIAETEAAEAAYIEGVQEA